MLKFTEPVLPLKFYNKSRLQLYKFHAVIKFKKIKVHKINEISR